jgi:hypothetical protein
MTKVTNTAEGPRGVETDSGTVYVEPGETVDVKIKDGHELYEGLTKGGAAKAAAASEEPKPLAKMNKTELLAVAKEAGVTVAHSADGAEVAIDEATNAQLVEAIEKAKPAD